MHRHPTPTARTPRLLAVALFALGALALLLAGGVPRAGADPFEPTEPAPVEAPEAGGDAVTPAAPERVRRLRRRTRATPAVRHQRRATDPHAPTATRPRHPVDDEPLAHRHPRSRPPRRGPPARSATVR